MGSAMKPRHGHLLSALGKGCGLKKEENPEAPGPQDSMWAPLAWRFFLFFLGGGVSFGVFFLGGGGIEC